MKRRIVWTSATQALTKIASTTASPASRSPRGLRRKNARPRHWPCVNASRNAGKATAALPVRDRPDRATHRSPGGARAGAQSGADHARQSDPRDVRDDEKAAIADGEPGCAKVMRD